MTSLVTPGGGEFFLKVTIVDVAVSFDNGPHALTTCAVAKEEKYAGLHRSLVATGKDRLHWVVAAEAVADRFSFILFLTVGLACCAVRHLLPIRF